MLIETIRTRPTVRRCVLVALAAAGVAAAPSSAQGADPGVTFDSGSPAGKEYAIPIALGRAEGAGTEDQQAAANTPFGVGVKPPGSGKGKDAGKGKEAGARDGVTGAGSDGASPGSSTTVLTPALRARLADAEDVGGTMLWTIGAAFLVALAAALLAVALRVRPARAAH